MEVEEEKEENDNNNDDDVASFSPILNRSK